MEKYILMLILVYIKEKIKINEFIWQVKAEGNELNFLFYHLRLSPQKVISKFLNNNYFNLLHEGKINNIKTN